MLLRNCFLFLFLLFSSIAHACLEQKVTLNCHPCSIEQVFESLDKQVSCSFSYNPSQFDLNQSVTGDFDGLPLNQVLNDVFEGKIITKSRGRHLLIESKKPLQKTSSKQKYIIEGIVKNARTGEVIQQATIYTVGDHYSALSDENGYYKIELSTQESQLGLSYSKQNYFDTILIVQPAESSFKQNVLLAPRDLPLEKMSRRGASIPMEDNTVEMLPMVRFLVPEKQRTSALNLEFLEKIPVQLSLLPSIGTNRLTSGHSENSISLNLISGYNAGLDGVEVGSTVNIIRQNAHGLQLGGVGNIVGGRVVGLQAGGVFNNVRGSVKGIQAAGVYNMVMDTVSGVQAAGVYNIVMDSVRGIQVAGVFNNTSGSVDGLQAAGVYNMTADSSHGAQAAGVFNIQNGSYSGGQLAGVFNMSNGKLKGLQAAGVYNQADESIGAQIAGVLNYSGDVKGAQISGAYNRAKDVNGIQIGGVLNKGHNVKYQLSGLVNVAKEVTGTQIGVLNFADSAGISFGLISFSKKGYHHLDVYADEVHFANLAFRTGAEQFHNILKVGYGSYYGIQLFSYGYGLGTTIHTKYPKLDFNIEASARQLLHLSNRQQPMNLDIATDLNFTYRLGPIALLFGPSLHLLLRNGQLQNLDFSDGPALGVQNGYPPIYNEHTGGTTYNMWAGLRLGVRI